jgi:hypothetical protein
MRLLYTVRTRSTASLTSPAMIRTRWNASLPEDTFGARRFIGPRGVTRVISQHQTNNNRKQVTYEDIRHPTVR